MPTSAAGRAGMEEFPMSKRLIAVLALLLTALPLAAASRVSDIAQRETYSRWDVLRAQSFRSTAIAWGERHGTPRSIYGVFTRPAQATADAARGFIATNAALFQMNAADGADLGLVREFDSPAGHHVVFAQRYRGLEVWGAEVAVHFNRDGEVIAVNNTWVPDLDVDVRPSFSPTGAAGRTGQIEARQLVIFDAADGAHLAWRQVEPTERETWENFIDAHSGELIVRRDMNRYATGTGRIFNVNAVVATRNNTLRDNSDAAAAVPASAYTTVSLLNLVGNGFLDGAYASSSATKKRVTSASNSFLFDRSSDGFSETMVYYSIDFAQRYIKSLGFTNVNNRVQVFSANGTRQDNSWYTGNNKQLTFGTGGVDDAEDAEVVLHEYGHSIQDNQKPGFGTSEQAGAMGEGFGDYWGASVNGQLSGGFQDTCVMDWDATFYDTHNPPCLRRLDTTKHYPESVDGEVHDDGEIWSGALWQIRTSIGATKADKLILQHHFLISVSASFNEAANALVTAGISLGYNTTELNSIRTILRNRGFTVTV
jgi:Zn-dependent metalloprotease